MGSVELPAMTKQRPAAEQPQDAEPTTAEEREKYNEHHTHSMGDCFPCRLMADLAAETEAREELDAANIGLASQLIDARQRAESLKQQLAAVDTSLDLDGPGRIHAIRELKRNAMRAESLASALRERSESEHRRHSSRFAAVPWERCDREPCRRDRALLEATEEGERG